MNEEKQHVNPRFRPRSQNMQKVSINDIVPGAGDRMSLKKLKDQESAHELNTGMKKAMNRFVKQLIEPQRDIIMNAIIDRKLNDENATVNAYEVLTDVTRYNERISDAMAKGADGFNLMRAQADLADTITKQRQIVENGGEIPDFHEDEQLMNGDDNLFESETIIIPRDYGTRINNRSRVINSMDDVFEDQIYVSPGTDDYVKNVDNNKEEDDNSIPIDPSMFL